MNKTGLTQKITKVAVIHELPLHKNKVFSYILRKSYKIKYIIFLTFLLILPFSVVHPAFASVCRNYDVYDGLHPRHQICILSINRSAKNYWEYRAVVSVDGVKRLSQVYNCREQVKIQEDGTVLPFEQKGPGEMICSFFNSSRR